MRLVYTADLHGDIGSYRSLLDLAVAAGARAVVVGGDLLPHAIKLENAIEHQRAFIDRQLRPLLAAFHQQHPAVAIYMLAGNDDWAAAIAALGELEQEQLAFPLHQRVYDLNAGVAGEPALFLAGYACVPITPFSIKDYERRDCGPLPPFSFGMAYASWDGTIQPVDAAALASRPSIAEDLDELAQRSDPHRTIYACHTPPANTPLDQMARGRHVGSQALRAFIEQRQPLLTLHGHIHEAPAETGRYAIQIGGTWSINPGHSERRFQAVTLDTNNLAATIDHSVFGRPAL